MNNKKGAREYIYSLMTDRQNGFTAYVIKFFLFLASLLYLAGINIIFLLRHSGVLPTARLKAKVISVGNLTLGGTGKTPLVEFVSRALSDSGKKTAILTRGYKIAPTDIPDEPDLLRAKLPQVDILAGADRVKNGKDAICKYGADVLVLDDGFQHWALSRDIDILAIDAKNPFGNGKLIPRGILREPVSGMARANIIVITKADAVSQQDISDIKSGIRALNPGAFIFTARHRPVNVTSFDGSDLGLDFLKGRKVLAVCGIADNDYFLKLLKGLCAFVKENIFFQDHHPYDFADLEYAAAKCRQVNANIIVVTEKDMVKIKPLIRRHEREFERLQVQFLAAGIKIEIIENEEKFRELILTK